MNSYRPRPVTRDTRHNDPRREEHRATADQRCAPAIGPTPKHRRVMPEEHTSTPPADFLEGRGPSATAAGSLVSLPWQISTRQGDD